MHNEENGKAWSLYVVTDYFIWNKKSMCSESLFCIKSSEKFIHNLHHWVYKNFHEFSFLIEIDIIKSDWIKQPIFSEKCNNSDIVNL